MKNGSKSMGDHGFKAFLKLYFTTVMKAKHMKIQVLLNKHFYLVLLSFGDASNQRAGTMHCPHMSMYVLDINYFELTHT